MSRSCPTSPTQADLHAPPVDSWVEIASQPSSSSLSSAADEIVLTGLRIQRPPHTHDGRPQRTRRRRRTMDATAAASSRLNIVRANSIGGTSSQEEYEESESESDRVMTSSGEGPMHGGAVHPAPAFGSRTAAADTTAVISDDDDDDHRTAINYPLNRGAGFTPQPNAFSHPPAGGFLRTTSSPTPNSYFPSSTSNRSPATARPTPRHSVSETRRTGALGSHLPQNPLSPTFNAAAQHEEALRASLNGLLSVAAAARGHSNKPDLSGKRAAPAVSGLPPPRGNRMDPASLRLLPESALPGASAAPPPAQPHEPTFPPTIRRHSITSTSTTSEAVLHQAPDKRHKSLPPTAATTSASSRNASRERRALKKARRDAAAAAAASHTYPEDFPFISPTLLTWLVSAGVVVFVSALSFRAGYALGRESGFAEGAQFAAGGGGRGVGGFLADTGAGGMLLDAGEFGSDCAREAGRGGLGLKRSLARGVVMV